jgi:hypothetical protein
MGNNKDRIDTDQMKEKIKLIKRNVSEWNK